MKYSYYNIIEPYGKDYVLYNTLTEKFMFISCELYHLFFNKEISVRTIREKHPNLYEDLETLGFIVDNRIDEPKRYIERLKHNGDIETCDNYNLIINPTLDCNLRCWYCYESLKKGSTINENLIKGIEIFIQNLINKPIIKQFTLSFFGGEPLLKFKKVIQPLITKASDLCRKKEVAFNVHFTTNAILLIPAIIENICAAQINLSVQVPFDGNECFHNKTKASNVKLGSYKRTINNVLYGISKGISFVIRCNCTLENIESFKDLVNEFSEIHDKNYVVFSIQIIWQEEKSQILRQKEKELYDYVFEKGFNKFRSSIPPVKCYADNCNSLVINYDGSVYKCTANDFSLHNREGIIDKEGKICFNEKYKERIDTMYHISCCTQCKLFPICDVCTQHKLKTIYKTGEFSKCSTLQMEEILNKRLYSLINSYENSIL
jgi:hypothetical protein